MINLREIDESINEIKRGGGNMRDAEKLAMLYIVRDHLRQDEGMEGTPVRERENMAREYSRASAPDVTAAPDDPQSEFLQVCDGVPVNTLLRVMDQHMGVIRGMFPRAYERIISELRAAKQA